MIAKRYPTVALIVLAGFALSCDPGEEQALLDPTEAPRQAQGGVPGPPDGGGDDDGDDGSTDDASLSMTFRDGESDNIRSDDRGSYVDGDCGVLADFNFNDARLDPDANYRGHHKRSCGDPRALVVEFDDPDDGGDTKATVVDGTFMNIDGLENVTGTDVLNRGQFNVCNRLVFDPNDSQFPDNGSDLLLVSFNDQGNDDPADDEWTVRTQPAPNDKGFCVGDERLWHMPFELVIRRK